MKQEQTKQNKMLDKHVLWLYITISPEICGYYFFSRFHVYKIPHSNCAVPTHSLALSFCTLFNFFKMTKHLGTRSEVKKEMLLLGP